MPREVRREEVPEAVPQAAVVLRSLRPRVPPARALVDFQPSAELPRRPQRVFHVDVGCSIPIGYTAGLFRGVIVVVLGGVQALALHLRVVRVDVVPAKDNLLVALVGFRRAGFARGTIPVPMRLCSRARAAIYWGGASLGVSPSSLPLLPPAFVLRPL